MPFPASPFEGTPSHAKHPSVLGSVGEKMKQGLRKQEGVTLIEGKEDKTFGAASTEREQEYVETRKVINRLFEQAGAWIYLSSRGAERFSEDVCYLLIDGCLTMNRSSEAFIEKIVAGLEKSVDDGESEDGLQGLRISRLLDYANVLSSAQRQRINHLLPQLDNSQVQVIYAKKLLLKLRKGEKATQEEIEDAFKEYQMDNEDTELQIRLILAEIDGLRGRDVVADLQDAIEYASSYGGEDSDGGPILEMEQRLGLYEESLKLFPCLVESYGYRYTRATVKNTSFPVAYRRKVLQLFFDRVLENEKKVDPDAYLAYADMAEAVAELREGVQPGFGDFEASMSCADVVQLTNMYLSQARIDHVFKKDREDIIRLFEQAERKAALIYPSSRAAIMMIRIALYRQLFGYGKPELLGRAQTFMDKASDKVGIYVAWIEYYSEVDPMRVADEVDTLNRYVYEKIGELKESDICWIVKRMLAAAERLNGRANKLAQETA